MDGQDVQRQRQRRVIEKERQRAVRACDNCRKQKEKCDGGVPCRRCTRLHRQCEFLRPPARDIETGPGPVRALPPPRLQGMTELEQRLGYMEKLLSHYTGYANLDSELLRNLAESVDRQQAVPQPFDAQSRGSDCLDDESFTVKPLDNNITHYSGEFSHWNFSMRIKQWIDQTVPAHGRNTPDDHNVKEYYRAEELQSSSSALTALASLPPRFVAEFLVQAFFKHAETNYFYVERGWLASKLDTAYENPSSLSRRDVGTVCMLFIILAIGTQHAYLDSCTDQPPDGLPNTAASGTGPFSEDAVGVMFYQQACRLVPDVITIASLESVQACLLIGLYTLPLDASGLSYIYLNLAVKLAVQNGMHRKYIGEGLDPAIRETRNRVWWTAYVTEKRVGIFHGRPVSIASADVDADLPVDCPDLWPLNPPSHYPRIMATLHLNKVLGMIANEISTLRTHSKHEISEGLGKLVDITAELRRWWESLPSDIFQKDVSVQSAVSRPDMHLKLEYCLVRMFAGRPFIFPRDSSGRSNPSNSSSPSDSVTGVVAGVPPSGPRPTTSSGSGGSSRTRSLRSALVADCVDAALTVIDTCQVLHHGISDSSGTSAATRLGLARASYTEFSACRAALLVIIAQCLQRRTDEAGQRLRGALRAGMAMIKEMAAGGESARSEASLIEAFERAIARLDAAAAEEEAATATASGAAESDYARFKRWEMLWKNDSMGQGQGPGQQQSQQQEPAGGSAGARSSSGQGASSMPLPPQLANFWQGSPIGTGRQGAPAMQAAAPFPGTDRGFSSFAQPMDELNSLFGYGFGGSYDHMTGHGAGNLW